jgi:hypothetical protein
LSRSYLDVAAVEKEKAGIHGRAAAAEEEADVHV